MPCDAVGVLKITIPNKEKSLIVSMGQTLVGQVIVEYLKSQGLSAQTSPEHLSDGSVRVRVRGGLSVTFSPTGGLTTEGLVQGQAQELSKYLETKSVEAFKVRTMLALRTSRYNLAREAVEDGGYAAAFSYEG